MYHTVEIQQYSKASGVTRVGITRAATDGVTPIFPEKTDDLFSHRRLQSVDLV